MKPCTKCKIWKHLDEFHKHKHCKDGINSICKDCQYKANKLYKEQNILKYAEYHRLRKQSIKDKLVKYKGDCCQVCKKQYHNSVYDFHHLDPSVKEARVSQLSGSSFKKAKEEVDKCILVCANCHRLIHAKEIIL